MSWWYWIPAILVFILLIKDLPATKERFWLVLTIWKWLSFKGFAMAWGTILLVLFFHQALDVIPFIGQISWTALLGDEMNIIASPLLAGAESGSWIGYAFLGLVLALLFFHLPRYAFWEECTFRQGYNTLREVPLRSLIFGLVHMIMGVSLQTALALAVGGAVFHLIYLREYEEAMEGYEMEMENSYLANRPKLAGPFTMKTKMDGEEYTLDLRLRFCVDEGTRFTPAEAMGVKESTNVHLAYNVTVFCLLVTHLVWSIF